MMQAFLLFALYLAVYAALCMVIPARRFGVFLGRLILAMFITLVLDVIAVVIL